MRMEGLLLLAARLSARAVSPVQTVGCDEDGGGGVLASRAWGGDAGGCAIVAAVWVARVELESGPLAHVQRGESGLGGISACALSRIVSAPRNGLIGIRVIL